MANTADGGPAFPTTPHYQKDGERMYFYQGAYGMSLRDWFAGQAIAGFIATGDIHRGNCDTAASDAYIIADAMLAARDK